MLIFCIYVLLFYNIAGLLIRFELSNKLSIYSHAKISSGKSTLEILEHFMLAKHKSFRVIQSDNRLRAHYNMIRGTVNVRTEDADRTDIATIGIHLQRVVSGLDVSFYKNFSYKILYWIRLRDEFLTYHSFISVLTVYCLSFWLGHSYILIVYLYLILYTFILMLCLVVFYHDAKATRYALEWLVKNKYVNEEDYVVMREVMYVCNFDYLTVAMSSVFMIFIEYLQVVLGGKRIKFR